MKHYIPVLPTARSTTSSQRQNTSSHVIYMLATLTLIAIALRVQPALANTSAFPGADGFGGEMNQEILDAPYIFNVGLTANKLQSTFYGDNNNPNDGAGTTGLPTRTPEWIHNQRRYRLCNKMGKIW
jgi:hypothetical protein